MSDLHGKVPNTSFTNDISDEEFAAASSPSDLRGRINLRIEQMLQQEIEDIAEDIRYPLHSVSEVVRFCCLLGIERLHDWKPRKSLLGAIKAANACIVRDRLQCESLELLGKMDTRVNWYIERQAYDEAISFIGQIMAYFEGLENDFWKEHFVTSIDERFKQWYARIEHCRKMDEQE